MNELGKIFGASSVIMNELRYCDIMNDLRTIVNFFSVSIFDFRCYVFATELRNRNPLRPLHVCSDSDPSLVMSVFILQKIDVSIRSVRLEN
jgi:hypothetical protein